MLYIFIFIIDPLCLWLNISYRNGIVGCKFNKIPAHKAGIEVVLLRIIARMSAKIVKFAS